MSENGRGKGTGMVNAQTVVSMRCAANQRNIVRQSNYALKAINGAGNGIGVHIIRELWRQSDRDGGSADCSVHAVHR